MNYYFITGTDTDSGKTYITANLLRYCNNAAAIKPVESGCTDYGNEVIGHDGLILQQNSSLDLKKISPWRFKQPVSPHIAAKQEGVHLSAAELAEYCLKLQLHDTERLFIEGAGGLMVPLNEQETWMDFLKITQFPVILVVGIKLGCINHALLTEAVLTVNQIPCVGWVANCLDPNMLELSANITTLTHKLNMPLLATVPFNGSITELAFF